MPFGALSDTKTAVAVVQEMVDKTKGEIEQKENKKYSIFKATEYCTQMVNGINHFIKVDVGQGEYMHLRILQPFSATDGNISLISYQTGKTANDPLIYFV